MVTFHKEDEVAGDGPEDVARARRGRARGYTNVPNTIPNQQQGGYGNGAPGMNGFYKQQRPMNRCGFDVEEWHTSATCPYPREGHVATATRENPCNGCMKASHKTQL
eukprot:CCRYP_020065-RA/>CCRYP_020065-RA protein AED:0.78 eAED:0.78 QI:0/0/0/0.5/0/0/2/0/106